MSTSKAFLDPLRVRLLRLQFTVGLGLFAWMLGSFLGSVLYMRLMGRIQSLPFDLLRIGLELTLKNLWVIGVLPLLCYGAARVVELRPWPTALGAAFAGRFFLFVILFVSAGIDGWLKGGWVVATMDWLVFAGGVVLCHRAVLRGRADAGSQAEKAREQAATKQDEYAEFLREAERAGEKIAQREAASAESQGAVVHVQPTPEQAPESAEPKPEDASKAPAA